MWRHSRRHSMAARADELALECEALLGGRIVDLLRAEGRPAPAWAWVNALAHGTREELATWAAEDPTPEPGGVSEATAWRMLMSFLADDLLTRADSGPATLADLQRSRLIPLELDLLRGLERPGPDAGRLATLVMSAVHGPQPR